MLTKDSSQDSKPQVKVDMEQIMEKVIKALEGLEYGEVVIKVQGGKVIWVDRHERERVG